MIVIHAAAIQIGVSTVIVPRAITTNLTYRNIDSFYNRYHDARCNFFTWDTTYLYTQNRRGKDLAVGFLVEIRF